jgi:ubiquitin
MNKYESCYQITATLTDENNFLSTITDRKRCIFDRPGNEQVEKTKSKLELKSADCSQQRDSFICSKKENYKMKLKQINKMFDFFLIFIK